MASRRSIRVSVFLYYCCDSTRGKSGFRFFEARFLVGGCFGGLHLACDCFAVLCCFAVFFFLPLPFRCARSMSLLIVVLW